MGERSAAARAAGAARPGHRFVLASAGTGKTFYLTNRFIALVASGEAAGEIVATTFTRKAAGEILERVTRRLANGSATGDGLAELRTHADAGLTPVRCAALLRTLALDAHSLQVQTLDAWLNRVASGMAFDLGIAPGWRVAEKDEDDLLRERGAALALEAVDAGRVGELIRLQKRGKPPMGAHRAMLSVLEEAYDAYKASDGEASCWRLEPVEGLLGEVELLEAVRALDADRLPEGAVPVTKAGAPDKSYLNGLRSVRDAAVAGDWKKLLTQGLTASTMRDPPKFGRHEMPEALVGLCAPLRAHAAAAVSRAYGASLWAAYELMRAFDESYQGLKRSLGMLQFDDVPRLLAEAGSQDLQAMYYRLDARVRHVLLDEFQDTNHTQFELLRPVIEELLSQDDQGRSVLVVGDVKQSLYGWRGAEPGLLERLPARYDPEGVCTERLSVSWRSSPVVLDVVNRVFRGIGANAALVDPGVAGGGPAAVAGRAFGASFDRHEAAKQLAGSVRLLVESEAPEGESDAESRRWASSVFIAERVRGLLARAPWASVGVLTRKNNVIADLVRALGNLGIPCRGERGNPLTDAAPCGVALSVLHLAEHPEDSTAAYHVSTSPMGAALGLVGVTSSSERRRASAVVRSRLASDGLSGVLTWLGRASAGSMTPRERARFGQLVELADRWSARPSGGGAGAIAARLRPSAFVRWVRWQQVPEGGASDGRRGGVSVMTVHHAKGLEFDAVVLAQLDEAWGVKAGTVLAEREPPDGPVTRVALYPNETERLADPRLQDVYDRVRTQIVREGLSGLYVGMTRARHALEMVVPWMKLDQDGVAFELVGDKPPTPARVLRAALMDDPGDNGEWLSDRASDGLLAFESGSDAWADEARGATGGDEVEGEGGAKARRVVVRLRPGARTRRASVVSPSKLDDDNAGPAAGGAGWFVHGGDEAGLGRSVGTLMHAWLGLIEWLEDGEPSASARAAAGAAVGVTPSEAPGSAWAVASGVYARAMEAPEVRAALSREAYRDWAAEGLRVEVRREWALAAVVAGDGEAGDPPRVVRGQVDRLVLGRDASGRVVRAAVLDFKTDRVRGESGDGAGATAVAARHAPQLRAYGRGVARAFGLESDRVTRSVVVLGAGRVIEIGAEA
ncbi:MAG: hypothetical protein EA378_03460 [Phycisphaerales bacterium]|nr:MAG: hypothetical protein EA378_03460 [Phycisphaerales bacterium]